LAIGGGWELGWEWEGLAPCSFLLLTSSSSIPPATAIQQSNKGHSHLAVGNMYIYVILDFEFGLMKGKKLACWMLGDHSIK
jgi:hypothetical protein